MASLIQEELNPLYQESLDIDYFLQYVSSRVAIYNQNMEITAEDSKLYYKLRHNLFKTTVLLSIGYSSVKERKFSSFPELGVDSERTPDFLAVLENKVILVEFTFVNKLESAYRTKEGFTKYDDEISQIKLPCESYYLALSLDNPVDELVEEIRILAESLDRHCPVTIYEEIDNLQKTLKNLTSYLYDFCPELLSYNTDVYMPTIDVEPLNVAPPFPMQERISGRKSKRNARIRSLFYRNLPGLRKSLRYHSSDYHYKIVLNFVTASAYLIEDYEGLTKDQITDYIGMESELLLDYVTITGDYKESNFVLPESELPPDGQVRKKSMSHAPIEAQYCDRYYNTLIRQHLPTLADSPLALESVQVPSLYRKALSTLHSGIKSVPYRRSPFILTPTDVLEKGSFVSIKTELGPLTTRLVRKAKGCDVARKTTIDRRIDYDSIKLLENKIYNLTRELKRMSLFHYKSYIGLPKYKLKEVLHSNEDSEILDKFLTLKDLKGQYSSFIKEQTRTSVQNRIKLKDASAWQLEIEHFKKPKNVYYLDSTLDFDNLLEDFRDFCKEIFEPTSSPVVDDLFSDTIPLGRTLADNCVDMRSMLEDRSEIYKSTRLAHSSLLNSQMAYSLLYYSNIKLDKDDYVFDNLGYSDVLLLVKGGKKIRSTRISRFFRLIVPITECQARILKSNTNTIFNENGKTYLLTPWRMLRITYLKKAVESYHNIGNYMISSSLEAKMPFEHFFKFASIKIMLYFSQRRSLEVWFGSLRYIYFNSAGEYSTVTKLIPDMAIIDHDPLIFLFQRLFIKNYQSLYENMRENRLYDIFWEDSFGDFDLLAERFDETLFMSKAPFNPVNEHMKNLTSILRIHDDFCSKIRTLDPYEILGRTSVEVSDGYFEKLTESDFNFDPKLSYLVGVHSAKTISAQKTKAELTESFNSILGEDYTTIATGKGMRDPDSHFWGRKGFSVVFDKLKMDVKDVLDNIPTTSREFSKMIREAHVSFSQKISETEPGFEFDIKDKLQYKGSREIYVMSDKTKLMQQPLEKFFKILCKCYPNELIHRPSGTRPKYIHSRVFEHRTKQKGTIYCTLDCSKWAPKSNLWKYYFFVLGMQESLPDNFLAYFFHVWSLMFRKKVRVQKLYADKLLLSESTKSLYDHLIHRDDGDFELPMPYSFMMGIFNYLSSLMHAASQSFFNDKFALRSNATCLLLAHSDDSGGMITSNSLANSVKVYSQYEKFQRSLNHLMSKKKSSLSVKSFEIISIMYINSRFVPMTHKFITNVALDMKGDGWYDDISSICSKVVDLYNNGGSLLQCYSLMLSNSELLRKAYHLPRLRQLSEVPLALGGLPNFHPIHLILMGNRAQEVLLDCLSPEASRQKRIKFLTTMSGDYMPGIGSRMKYISDYYRHAMAPNLDDNSMSKLSSLATLPDKNTLINFLSHQRRLFDKSYVYSLTGVDANQILLATLFFKCKVLRPDGTALVLSEIPQIYLATQAVHEEALPTVPQIPFTNYMSYVDQVERMSIDFKQVDQEYDKSCKPVLYATLDWYDVKVSNEDMLTLSAIEKWPQLGDLIRNPKKYVALKEFLIASLPGELLDKLNYLKNYDPQEKTDKLRSGYLYVPSNFFLDTVSRFFTYAMLYTSRRYLISRQKPQLFVPTEFNLYNKGYECSKHKHLCFRLFENDPKCLTACVKSLRECQICGSNFNFDKDLLQYSEYMKVNEFLDFKSSLPFALYHRPQTKGRNVWVDTADFTIYTVFGNVDSKFVDGNVHTTWHVSDGTYLSALWGLYRIFVLSRGMKEPVPKIGYSGYAFPRLAFSNQSVPYIPELHNQCSILENSKVVVGSYGSPSIHRRGQKFFSDLSEVDFKIFSVYDVNHGFFDLHNLSSLKEHVYRTDLEVEEEAVMQNFNSTKMYNILTLDERHFSTSERKYERTGLLGAPGSFTRALSIADENGMIRYRNSSNPGFVTKQGIEYEMVESVPVLDMFEKFSFVRVSLSEKISFDKVLSSKMLTTKDQKNLISIKSKIGLEALGSSLLLYQHVFREFVASSVSLIEPNVLFTILSKCIDIIHYCMLNTASGGSKHQYKGTRTSWWSCLRYFIDHDFDCHDLPQFIVSGLLRAKNDNEDKYWQLAKENFLLAVMSLNDSSYLNCVSLFLGMIEELKTHNLLMPVFHSGDNYLYRPLFFSNFTYNPPDFTPEIIDRVILMQGEHYLMEEDALDECLVGGIEELESDVVDREFDEDNEPYHAEVVTDEDIMAVSEEIANEDFSEIVIKHPFKYICFPWLGRGDYDVQTIDGISWYVSKFPGNKKYTQPILRINSLTRSERHLDTELLKNIIDPVNTPMQVFPNSITTREGAISAFEKMGIKRMDIINIIFPDNRDIFESLDEVIMKFVIADVKPEEIKEIVQRRVKRKSHLPGFSSNLKDKILEAELFSLFGSNYHYIVNGQVKLAESSYKQMMKFIRRNYNKAGTKDRAVMMFLISILLDTYNSEQSDSWFYDKVNKIIDDMDDRLNPEFETVILPVAAESKKLDYREKPLFEGGTPL